MSKPLLKHPLGNLINLYDQPNFIAELYRSSPSAGFTAGVHTYTLSIEGRSHDFNPFHAFAWFDQLENTESLYSAIILDSLSSISVEPNPDSLTSAIKAIHNAVISVPLEDLSSMAALHMDELVACFKIHFSRKFKMDSLNKTPAFSLDIHGSLTFDCGDQQFGMDSGHTRCALKFKESVCSTNQIEPTSGLSA